MALTSQLANYFSSVLLPPNYCYADDDDFIKPPELLGLSAVLILLNRKANGEWSVLMNERSKNLRRYPGEVCFPGGMREKVIDASPIDTALREANEEIGLRRTDVDIVGMLRPVLTRHFILIFPVLAHWNDPMLAPKFQLSAEVDHFFWVPLEQFLSQKSYAFFNLEDDFRIHIFFMERVIYGITSVLAVSIAMGIYDRFPDFPFPLPYKHVNNNEKKDNISDEDSRQGDQTSSRASLRSVYDYFAQVRPVDTYQLTQKKFAAALNYFDKHSKHINNRNSNTNAAKI